VQACGLGELQPQMVARQVRESNVHQFVGRDEFAQGFALVARRDAGMTEHAEPHGHSRSVTGPSPSVWNRPPPRPRRGRRSHSVGTHEIDFDLRGRGRLKSRRIGTARCTAKLGGICTRSVLMLVAFSLRISSRAYSRRSNDFITAGSSSCPAFVKTNACGRRRTIARDQLFERR